MAGARDTAASKRPLAAQPSSTPLLSMEDISKRYGATLALNGVNLEVRAGEIHALLGENGAGKSTLMHVLSGMTSPDQGVIRMEGRPVRIPSARDARALGIAMVHQHFTLVPAFTVAENLALDTPRSPGLAFDPRQVAGHALEVAASLGWHLSPDSRVATLSVGLQQRVEIVKALATEARLLIFDEPTAVLGGDEVEELFTVLRRLRDSGKAVILIAHKLAEILAVADHVTVLRRGNRVASCPVSETNAHLLASWMVGASLTAVPSPAASHELYTASSSPENRTREIAACTARNLEVRGERGETLLRDVSLEVRSGEILGIGGVDGNGQTELAEVLVGLRSLQSGTLQWNGQPFRAGTAPRLGYIPQDRRQAGLAVSMTIEENLLFGAVQGSEYRRGPFLRRKALRDLAASLVQQFDIRTPSAHLPASALSGGNQQKVVIARALYAEPEWIVAVNPTRGLDIGATRFVHEQLRGARARGAAIVLISTDLDEINALADRGAILASGALTEYTPGQADTTQLGLLLGGIQHAPGVTS